MSQKRLLFYSEDVEQLSICSGVRSHCSVEGDESVSLHVNNASAQMHLLLMASTLPKKSAEKPLG